MTVKKIVIILLLAGIVFSGAFPQSVYGTDMVLADSSGDTTSGDADYTNSDGTVAGQVSASSMSYEEWTSYDYTANGWTLTTDTPVACYYICDASEDEYGSFSYCWMDCHKDNTYYMIDAYVDGGTVSEALYEDTALANAILESNGGNNNNNNGGDNGGNNGGDNGGSGNGDNGTGGGIPIDFEHLCPVCPISMGLVLLGAAAIRLREN